MKNQFPLLLAIALAGCGHTDPVRVVRVSLANSETYRYPTFVGDEEGAALAIQAKHYRISEVRRDSTTRWDAVYLYQPAAGFIGSDFAAIRVYRGSDGASLNTDIQEVRFYFSVGN